MIPEKYTAIDLFSGAGGFSAGLAQQGFRVLAAVDNVQITLKTHQFNFPESQTICADLADLSPEAFSRMTGIRKGTLDIVVGSPPCQTFSSIGVPKIKSLANDIEQDPRNYLPQVFLDYVDYFKPDLFLMENVPAMKTKFGGALFQGIWDQIHEMGYEPQYRILECVEFGVPQTRKRLVIAGTAKGIVFNFPERTHFHINGKNTSSQSLFDSALAPATTVYDAISDLPSVYDGCREDELPYTKFDELTEYQVSIRNKGRTVKNNICRMSNERAKKVFVHMAQGSKYMDLDPKIRKILPFREEIFHDRLKRLNLSKPSWTVIAHIGMDGYMYIHPTETRTLSVREAARIQGFQDSFVFFGNMREQYVQVGNAVPPILAAHLAKSVLAAMKGRHANVC